MQDQTPSRPAWPSPEIAAPLLKQLQKHFGYHAHVFPAPHVTGRALWTLTRPEWRTLYPPMDIPMQHRYRSTGGQGRIETHTHPEPTIPGVFLYDMRTAYMSGCQRLPAGPPVHTMGDHAAPSVMGRFRVRFRIPDAWDHIGILMVPDSALRWRYPSDPGGVYETWASRGEVATARRWGWDVDVLESITFPDSDAYPRPLDIWIIRLQKIWQGAPPAGQAVVRDIVLQTIGAFHEARRREPVTIPDSEPLPAGAQDVLWDNETHTYSFTRWAAPLPENAPFQHPEWAMEVWARARVRLLDYRGQGALYVPREAVLGVRTDALYLTQRMDWEDDGKVGSLRLKAYRDGPLPTPVGAPALRATVSEAE